MPKQNFKLQPVLNYKSDQLDLFEVEFARLKFAQQEAQAVLDQLEQVREELLHDLYFQQQGLLDYELILIQQQYLQALELEIAKQTAHLEKLARQVETKREALTQLMKERKSLEKLRAQSLATQQRELQRREARQVDDLVTTRYARER